MMYHQVPVRHQDLLLAQVLKLLNNGTPTARVAGGPPRGTRGIARVRGAHAKVCNVR